MNLLHISRSLVTLGACWLGAQTLTAAPFVRSIPKSEPFGAFENHPVELYTLQNANGCEARISTYGGIVTSLKMPDRDGQMADVVLGFSKLEDYRSPAYLKSNPYFGALIGRYGNRISKGKFTLEGKPYTLAINNDANHLHGGAQGFNQRVWQAMPFVSPEGEALELRYVSPDKEEGYPGTVSVKAVYTLTDHNELRVAFEATTSKPTVINLTHHSYFNLRGEGSGDVLGHLVMIKASKFTPIDAGSIPLPGPARPVEGTPFDFREPIAIGARIGADDEQLKNGHGYDHNFVLDDWTPGSPLRLIARVTEPTTGRTLEVESTEPGVQFYTGNFLDGTLTGKSGKPYAKHDGMCFEPQHFPDSPNRPDFPSVELKPSRLYKNTIVYRFGVEK